MSKERKKSIIIYIIILILFSIFSIYIVTKNNTINDTISTKNKENVNIENEITSSKNLDTSSDEIGSEYEKECINTVKDFLKYYHSINDLNHLDEFEKVKDKVVEPLFVELKNEVIGSSSMPTNGYIFRTIEKLNVYDYEFDDTNKSITLKAKVYSNWLDKDKAIASKNELTEYDFLLINDMGKWKISQISSDII